MPIAASPSTSRRLLALLSLLQARRDWPAPILAERLEVSERTVRRDIERLRELDYVIDSTRGPDGGYRLGAGSRLPPLLFDDEQVVALTLALRTAGTLGAGVEEAAERALGTVLRMLPERLAQRVGSLAAVVDAAAHATATATRDPSHPAPGGPDGRDGGPAERDGPADPAVLLRIGEAIRSRHELRFDYASPGPRTASERPVRVVEPHHLLFRGGRWYLLGFSPEHEDWRVHRADRIAPRSHDGRRFEPRAVPGGDPARYLAARFRGATAATAGD
ncbi:MAG: WYL domain-containing protein, partial [Solirubrobacteraceae bacterium]|nr:WYL domain-containing protein [Solirubrobacteraceae bacterium]